VLETHNHADHVSGHGRLAASTGATIHIHREADAQYPHEPFDDGWELELGSLLVRAIHTPGHRPEHTAFALIDTARGDEPWAVLTGDTLFVGDIARPDLAVDKVQGARAIFHSLHEKLLTLPGETEVWPGHLGGSLCGGPDMDMKVSSTIGYERRHNELLTETDEDRFIERSTAKLPPQPPNFQAVVKLNRGPLLIAGVEVGPLAPRQLEQKRSEGALLVDVRTDLQFDEAHIPGSVSITMLSAGFGTKLSWIADRGQEVVLIGRDDEDARTAARLAVAVGIRNLGGYLAGGMTSWRAEHHDVDRIERIGALDLRRRMDGDSRLQVLDVRERPEWEAGHIPGSIHVPYHDIHGIPDSIDVARPVAVICSSGTRSAVAASLVKRYGASDVSHIADGGVGTWREHGYPIAQG
jgi:hydroxyacylglutathione hydrolase